MAGVDDKRMQLRPNQRFYLAMFRETEKYYTYYRMQDNVQIIQGAERKMIDSLRKFIRSIDSQ